MPYTKKNKSVGGNSNPDKTFKKQIRKEARAKFKPTQFAKKFKYKKEKWNQYKKDWEEGSWE
tara:strand:+ start:412 stop:597 length:186 start_codon:yes stop_codon:yes gene_type:complete